MNAMNGVALAITMATFGPLYAARFVLAREAPPPPRASPTVGRLGEPRKAAAAA